MNPRHTRLLVTLLIVLVALFSIGSDLTFKWRTFQEQRNQLDPVSDWEKRIAPLKEELPKRGTIGFLSDWDLPGWSGSLSDMDNEFRLTQYALAPLVLVRGADQEWVIGNFTDPADLEQALELYGLVKIREFGMGISLLAPQP